MLQPKYLGIVFGLILNLTLSAQDSLRWVATQQLRSGDYTTVVKTYDLLFTEYRGNGNDYYNVAFSWSLLKNQEMSLRYLDSAFLYGFTNLNHAKTDPDLTLARQSPRFNALIEREEAFYKEENIDYLWILEALTKRPVVSLRNKSHYNSISNWLNSDGISAKQILDARPDLDLKLTSDSLIDFSDKNLVIQNGKGTILLERLKLNRLVLASSTGILKEGDRVQNIIGLHDIQVTEMSWSLQDYDIIRFFRVEVDKIEQNYMAGLGRLNITDSKLTLTQQFFEPNLGRPYYPFGTDQKPIDMVMFKGNEFKCQTGMIGRIPLEINSPSIDISSNVFHNEVDFFNSRTKSLNMYKNRFMKAVNIDRTNFHSPINYLPYRQFEGGFGVNGELSWEQWQTRTFVIGEKEEVNQAGPYDKLIYNYKLMHTNYKERGDMVSANAAYIDLKDLMLNHDYAAYQKTGSYERLIQYQIGKLLKFYTRSGTSPARAILVSFFIILLFSFIYLLFPSEWDTKSKKRMIEDYRIFKEKNEKGYIRPFFVMLLGIIRSWLNAFALSLNAFVTLGFGAIPTKGIGRYICIIQGFMGWFLLSIFTVSLINQVLI
ncbi:hypothetical protein BFP97_01150 [Roseivirga sp. 4D4]|uniref:TPR end-of-group domain-containing protein n=1 Tax=Roseivirga sp. 4D4 TaxID=1889784 RepID=UPI0008536E1A|nr:two pore domain potassium channel family protein [Roseivirga sp. 4D4]OEK00201.1 hypothetical protein BFP97_01150 [Roseivirga sp. 4D4]